MRCEFCARSATHTYYWDGLETLTTSYACDEHANDIRRFVAENSDSRFVVKEFDAQSA